MSSTQRTGLIVYEGRWFLHSTMDRGELEEMVSGHVSSAITASQNVMLTEMTKLISTEVKKISDNQKSISELQLSKIASINASDYKFKRKSNEEQFKVNKKALEKIDDCDRNLSNANLQEAKENLAEASNILKRRQKLIRIADESDMGWKVVDEYMQSEVASDEEDQKRIHRAQSRATRKMKSDRGRRGRRPYPYPARFIPPVGTPASATVTRHAQQTQQPQRRLGTCFACGESGHWKFECPNQKHNVKLSIENGFVCFDQIDISDAEVSESHDSVETVRVGDLRRSEVTDDTSGRADEQNVSTDESFVSPYNRLKNCKDKWKQAGSDQYIMSVIEDGYKIPFKEVPDTKRARNNKSARDNPQFVESEINKLLSKKCISRVDSEPHIVNPLTVAYNKKNKPRLVLDCRNINDNLHKFRFKYEDIQVARQLFEKGYYMFTFDIRGAYNHIDIFQPHRAFLGFSWPKGGKEAYYVYNSLPFGLASAGHIFCKVLRVLVMFWRSKGHRVLTFLDDGLGGSLTFNEACTSSTFIRQSLKEFGFLLSEEKCQWQPSLEVSWLGYFLCMKTGRFFISSERIDRTEASIKDMLCQLEAQQYQIVPAKFAASVVGRIMSAQAVIGKIVRMKTRELYRCIDSRVSRQSPIYISEKAKNELKFWSLNLRVLNDKGRDIKEKDAFEVALFADASSDGYGGYIELDSPVSDDESVWGNNPRTGVHVTDPKVRSDRETVVLSSRRKAPSELKTSKQSLVRASKRVSPEVETECSPEVEVASKFPGSGSSKFPGSGKEKFPKWKKVQI